MSYSTYDLLLEESMFERMYVEPELLKTTVEVLGRLRARQFYDPNFADAVFQKGQRFQLTLTDAWGFLQAYMNVLTGRWRIAAVTVGDTPLRDKETEGNNARLQGLAPHFGAVFEGGAGDHDGSFWWHDHLHLGGPLRINDKPVDGPPVTVGPDKVILEVGCQDVGKTLTLMHQYKALARWPYGSDRMWIFYDCSENRSGFSPIETSCTHDKEQGWSCMYSDLPCPDAVGCP